MNVLLNTLWIIYGSEVSQLPSESVSQLSQHIAISQSVKNWQTRERRVAENKEAMQKEEGGKVELPVTILYACNKRQQSTRDK